MRNFVLLLFLGFNVCFVAQESYEFVSPLPPSEEIVEYVSSSYFGKYENFETGTEIIVNSNGITLLTIIHSFITQEQVRESSKYTLRNGYLFGVIENDSVLYVQDGDKYYFGIKNKIRLNDAKNGAVIKKINESNYIINFKENNSYSPSLLSFKGKNLSLKHFDYPSETKIFEGIKIQDKILKGDLTLVRLNPNQKEWEKLDKKIIFGKEIVFEKK